MERKRRLRSILAFMLTFAVVLGMVPLPGMTKEAQAADVTPDSTIWPGEMTVNENMTIKSRVTVSGAVTLTLSAGKTLIAKKGITVPEGSSLNITGTGTLYAKEIAKLRREVQRISNNKGGLYEDYRDKLITAEELCQYQNEYEERIKEISGQIDILLIRQRAYEKDFHINEDWEETVNKYLKRRNADQVKQSLTLEMADVFVSKVICHPGGNIEVHLVYDDFMEELLKISEEREAENGR